MKDFLPASAPYNSLLHGNKHKKGHSDLCPVSTLHTVQYSTYIHKGKADATHTKHISAEATLVYIVESNVETKILIAQFRQNCRKRKFLFWLLIKVFQEFCDKISQTSF
jgi:hypothetical protein